MADITPTPGMWKVTIVRSEMGKQPVTVDMKYFDSEALAQEFISIFNSADSFNDKNKTWHDAAHGPNKVTE